MKCLWKQLFAGTVLTNTCNHCLFCQVASLRMTPYVSVAPCIVYCMVSLHSFSHDIPLHSSQFSQRLRRIPPPDASLNPCILWLLLCLSCCSGWSSSCCICCRKSCCTQTCCRQLLSCEGSVCIAEVSSCHGCISLRCI